MIRRLIHHYLARGMCWSCLFSAAHAVVILHTHSHVSVCPDLLVERSAWPIKDQSQLWDQQEGLRSTYHTYLCTYSSLHLTTGTEHAPIGRDGGYMNGARCRESAIKREICVTLWFQPRRLVDGHLCQIECTHCSQPPIDMTSKRRRIIIIHRVNKPLTDKPGTNIF